MYTKTPKPPTAVPEVGEWLAALGLSQYRKKFTHNMVDGGLLVKLGDQELKVRRLGEPMAKPKRWPSEVVAVVAVLWQLLGLVCTCG
jgi:hypothetical protein